MPTKNDLPTKLKEAKGQAISTYYEKRHQTVTSLAYNVVGVGIGHKGTGTKEEPGVHVYVDGLIPKHPDHRIPLEEFAKTSGVAAHLIETGRFYSFAPEAAPGSTIGLDYEAPNIDPSATSTWGAVVDIMGEHYALGTNHAMRANGYIPAGRKLIFCPANRFVDDSTRYVFALTADYVELKLGLGERNFVDCALAKINNGHRVEMANKEVKSSTPIDAYRGMRVKRVDEIDNAIGTVVDVHARILMDYPFGTVDLEDQVIIESDDANKPFARRGDSGALLVDQETKQATALVVGGSQKYFRSRNPVAYAVACPISKVFEELEVVLGIPERTIKLVVPARPAAVG